MRLPRQTSFLAVVLAAIKDLFQFEWSYPKVTGVPFSKLFNTQTR
jgi:hypothetical protein